ncbi:3-oxoacyl-[acyl-carrier-protein] reductase FabG [Tersicoccus solisilvae]|uniref:3-oxoacyl-[acyl-carrier-protein] reductase FabG n=1 Tax=Tersicoccus solisilvae TaxID=1882339 RepID=A0ABQ1NVA8_9MICC|nr:SDR family NAD(P)-dependent oxidoreductase [Tersicoccus solisilvae]GGC84809.1 3-oxoacyl-[acyl-carrier-protein] reductase FabG [Tersicoccus solisilvae]
MGRLQDKVAVITGIGGGMGREAARRFAAEGARVVGCDLHAEGLEETVRMVREEGGAITGHAPVDLSDAETAAEWIDWAAAAYGCIDILYNNAGVQRFGPIDELAVEDWELNVRGELSIVFYAVRAAWKHLKRRGGTIVNIGSIAGTRGVEFMPQNVHGAAKAGVINLTQQLAVEGGPHGIRAVCISPGFIETPATKFLVDNPPPAMRAAWDRIPLGRVGQPDDIVNAAVFLASDEATWITGVNLVVDGGGSVLG